MKFTNELMRKRDVKYVKLVGVTDGDDNGNYVYQHSKVPVPEQF